MKISSLKESNSKYDFSNILTNYVKMLGNIFKKYGHELRVVGGAVRDSILGKNSKDIDLSSTATPEQMLKITKDNNLKVIETGLQHGTLTFVINNEPFEVTTLRTDKETDGRHATVEWTNSFKEDAERRDLTFNALSVDMNGKLYDYFNGEKDLLNGIARFIGNTKNRIQEDYLRILRYFRFLGRQASPKKDIKTLNKIKKNVEGLNSISGERIWVEMSKILSGKNIFNILLMMCESKVLQTILLKCNRDKVRNAENISNLSNNPITILSALIDNEFDFMKIIDRYKLPNPDKKLGIFINVRKQNPLNIIPIKKDIVLNNIDKNLFLELAYYKKDHNVINMLKSFNVPPFPITGNDLLNAGITSGPELGKILHNLKEKWLNSDFKLTKEQLLKSIP